jgi:hypothetical protein
MRNHISSRAELLDDLEAPGFLNEHALGLVIRMARFHDKTSRHPPNELALAGRVKTTSSQEGSEHSQTNSISASSERSSRNSLTSRLRA